jgi:hypothetical protein
MRRKLDDLTPEQVNEVRQQANILIAAVERRDVPSRLAVEVSEKKFSKFTQSGTDAARRDAEILIRSATPKPEPK